MVIFGLIVMVSGGCVRGLNIPLSEPVPSERSSERSDPSEVASQGASAGSLGQAEKQGGDSLFRNSLEDESPEPPSFGNEDMLSVVPRAPTVTELEDLRKNLFRYVKNMVATKRAFGANLSTRDEEIIEFLMEQDLAARTPLERAVLFIALLEHAVVEYDHLVTNAREGVVVDGGGLFAELSRDYGIDVLPELKRNAILHHPVIYHMSFLVMHHVSVYPQLLNDYEIYLSRYAKAWVALHESMESQRAVEEQSIKVDPGASTHENISAAIERQNERYQESGMSMGELAEGEELIAQAAEFHSQNMFREALEQLAQIPPGSAHYPSAQELTEQYSGDAVEELRQKAAQLFQDHLRVNSLDKKMAYLTQAREYLREAIADYPGTKWQRRIQDNLMAIQQRLEEYERMKAQAS